MNTPLLSVVIVNWNAQKYIIDCLRSVLNSDYTNLQVILIDNHSQDSSIELINSRFTAQDLNRIKAIVNDKNYGAAYALNQGMKFAVGKYVSFIASDTKVDSLCFNELIKVLESDNSIGAVSAKLFMMDESLRFDSVGEYLSQYGILIQRHAGQEINRGQFNEAVDIFSVKGTALTVRRDLLQRIGGFPEDYFMFLEETDLCWRIWLSGYRIVFVPAAYIYHVSGFSLKNSPQQKYLVKFFGTKNYIFTLIKNFGLKNLSFILPMNIGMWFAVSFYMLLKGRFKDAWYINKGIFWNLFNLGYVLKKRREVQGMRVVSDKEVMPKIMKRINIKYLFDRVFAW